jgi:hypothetical protein
MVDRCPVYIPYPINLGLCGLGLGLRVVIRSSLVLLLVWIRTGGADATVPLKLKLLPFVLVHGRSSPGSARRAEARPGRSVLPEPIGSVLRFYEISVPKF